MAVDMIARMMAMGNGGGTADAYTKEETDALLADKADKSTTYTKTEADAALAEKLNTADVDSALSGTSTNPVQNKAIQAPIAGLIDNGAKNLLEIADTSRTINGVTFSVNNDGTITANGTATSDAIFNIGIIGCDTTGTILSGCPVEGLAETTTCALYVRGTSFYDYGDSVLITENVSHKLIACVIYEGYTANNITFKPMLCTAEDWAVSHEFVPYAPTNRKLYKSVDFMRIVHRGLPGESSGTVRYQMAMTDFLDEGNSNICGMYLIMIVDWSTTPSSSIYSACYSGGLLEYHALTKIGGADAQLTIDENGLITYTGKGKIQIYALQ